MNNIKLLAEITIDTTKNIPDSYWDNEDVLLDRRKKEIDMAELSIRMTPERFREPYEWREEND